MAYLLSSYKDDAPAYNLLKASLLQKLIRRGMVEEANYVAQLYINDNQSQGLKRRLQIIAAEDIGIGWSESVLYIEQQPDLIKVTSALAQADKNRESDRFLLAVAYNYSSLLNRGEVIKKEADSLKYLMKLSTAWVEDKRNKENLKQLTDAFHRLANLSLQPEVVNQLTDNYMSLTKAKIHGARCQMALAVLIALRNTTPSFWSPDESRTKIKEFDEIFDFAIDMHTPIGKQLGRDFNHWIANCVEVIPEITYPELFDSAGKEKYPLLPESNKFNK